MAVEGARMSVDAIPECRCPECLAPADSPSKELHRQMLRFFRTLPERQRRLYAALEARKFGRGGLARLSLITGLHVQTIRRGLRELDAPPSELPPLRSRRPGGGRPRVEKKLRRSSTTCGTC